MVLQQPGLAAAALVGVAVCVLQLHAGLVQIDQSTRLGQQGSVLSGSVL